MLPHCMSFSHIEYFITNWSPAGLSKLGPIKSLFRIAVKVLDEKSFSFHPCPVFQKYSFDHFKNLLAVYMRSCMDLLRHLSGSSRTRASCNTLNTFKVNLKKQKTKVAEKKPDPSALILNLSFYLSSQCSLLFC